MIFFMFYVLPTFLFQENTSLSLTQLLFCDNLLRIALKPILQRDVTKQVEMIYRSGLYIHAVIYNSACIYCLKNFNESNQNHAATPIVEHKHGIPNSLVSRKQAKLQLLKAPEQRDQLVTQHFEETKIITNTAKKKL